MRLAGAYLVAILMSGCATVSYDLADRSLPGAELQQRVDELSQVLASLDRNVNPYEAQRVADIAVHYPLALADEYQLTRPPLAHNMLVNAKLRPRGLCIHWTEDLIRKLHLLGLHSLDLWWVTSTRPTPFHVEHSSVVVTPRGESFEEGIVLDGWRDSGWLYWTPVRDDKYEWNLLDWDYTGTGLWYAKAPGYHVP